MLCLLAFCFAGWLIAYPQHAAPDLTVHEWGTFTAVAGSDGHAIEWMPLTGPEDLPSFVEHLSGVLGKAGLRGTIRMETPVLYFYSPRDLNASVKVSFSDGVITEWYPHAAKVTPSGPLRNINLSGLERDGSIRWDNVAVSPNLAGGLPREAGDNRYYAARETSATPLRVSTPTGEQHEKFLFYRGVSAARLPISAEQTTVGKLLVRNLSANEIPAAILFERSGERVGYRVAQAPATEMVLDPSTLNGTVDSLRADLERILVDQGLYPDEARAMIETWHDSWFEEGSRLIYIVPRAFVDRILPLTINPAPGQLTRVFVGRLEIVTPETIRAVETARASNDDVTLSKYARFLQPILEIAKQKQSGSGRQSGGGR